MSPDQSRGACRYQLGQAGLEYVLRALEGGGSLAQAVGAKSLNSPFTFQACDLGTGQLEQFAAGQQWMQRSVTWGKWIESFLARHSDGLALAQVYGIETSAPYLQQRTAYWRIADEVVAYADGSLEAGVDALFRNMSEYPSVVVLCGRGREFVGREEVASGELEAMAASAEFVLIGAYDEESFVAASCE